MDQTPFRRGTDAAAFSNDASAASLQLARLRQFVAPELFDELGGCGRDDKAVAADVREVVVVFADLRGYTRFADRYPLERLAEVLDHFHGAMGEAIRAHGGTLERFTGDGVMVFFPARGLSATTAEAALAMASAMHESTRVLAAGWRRDGIELGLGIGIARGLARVGPLGCDWRKDYGAVGRVVNLAQRLCARAEAGETLVERSTLADHPHRAAAARRLRLDGFRQPVEVARLRSGDDGKLPRMSWAGLLAKCWFRPIRAFA